MWHDLSYDGYWIHNVWEAPQWTEELAKYFDSDSLDLNVIRIWDKEMK